MTTTETPIQKRKEDRQQSLYHGNPNSLGMASATTTRIGKFYL